MLSLNRGVLGGNMNYYANGFKKMTDFKGRSSRKDFWIFYLINMVIIFLLLTLTIGATFTVRESRDVIVAQIILVVFMVYVIVTVLPIIAMTIRRLHDAGFSGWWLLIYFIPNIGFIALLILAMFPSKIGDNKYGPNPYGKNFDSTTNKS